MIQTVKIQASGVSQLVASFKIDYFTCVKGDHLLAHGVAQKWMLDENFRFSLSVLCRLPKHEYSCAYFDKRD